MEITIHKLKEDNLAEYLDFFKKENQCFCVNWTGNTFHGEDFELLENRKSYEIRSIKNQTLQGYLAYEKEKVIGWCNTNDRNECAQCEGWRKILTSVQRKPSDNVKVSFVFVLLLNIRSRALHLNY